MTCIPLKIKRRKHDIRKNKEKNKNKNKVDENKNVRLELRDKHISDYIGRDMSGARFKKYFPDLSKKLVKLTNETENHNGFQFVTGLNEDSIPFNPIGECKKGGIYFTDIDNLPNWLYYNKTSMKYYRYITLPDDCRVYLEPDDKLKADKIILSKREEIKDLPYWSDEDYCLNAIKKAEKEAAKYIKILDLLDRGIKVPDKLIIAAIRQNDFDILDLLDHGIKVSDKVIIAALEQDSYVFPYLLDHGVNVSNEVQLAAIRENIMHLRDLFERNIKVSDDVILAALEESEHAASYILHYNQKVSWKVEMDENFKRGVNYYTYRSNHP